MNKCLRLIRERSMGFSVGQAFVAEGTRAMPQKWKHVLRVPEERGDSYSRWQSEKEGRF